MARPSLPSLFVLAGSLFWLGAVGLLMGLWSWGDATWLPSALLSAGAGAFAGAAITGFANRRRGPKEPLPAALAPALAVIGALVWLFAIGSGFGFVARGPTDTESMLINGGLVLGLACHLAALAVSLARWRQGAARVPVVAAGYGITFAMALAAWMWARGSDERYLRDSPGSFLIEEIEDERLEIRDAAGSWIVPLDACPGQGDASPGRTLGTRQRDGIADVSYGSDAHYMRLHMAERRVECL